MSYEEQRGKEHLGDVAISCYACVICKTAEHSYEIATLSLAMT
jgi:hypothetical protein